MKIDVAYSGTITGVEAAARRAVEEGFGCLWASETRHDPFLTLTLAARAAPNLELGTGIAVALARNPYSLAQSAWDLATISGGRFRLGLGSQVKAHVSRRFSMPWHNPIGQMRETVEAIRAVWRSFQTGSRLDYRGKYYQHTLLTPNFNPGPLPEGEIPIGLAAVGPQMTRLAGEIADFILLHPFNTVSFLREVTLPALGDRREAIEVVGSLFAFSEGPEAEKNEQAVRRKVAFYGSTPAYREVLGRIGREDLFHRLHPLSKAGRWAEMADLVDDDVLEKFRIRAPRDELFNRVRQRFDGLCDRVVLTMPGD